MAGDPERDAGRRPSWPRLAWRVVVRFDAQQMTHHAAAMTYYTMLSLFPGLLLGVAALGAFGQQHTVTRITDYLRRHGAAEKLVAPIDGLLRSAVATRSGAVSLTLAGSLLVALFGASGAFAAARRALNVVFGVQENRPIVRRKLADMGATLVLITSALVILVLVFLGGGVADELFGVLGLGSGAAAVWQVARWPAAIGVTLLVYAFVYTVAPDIEPRRHRTFTPGALVAVPLWMVVSYGFFTYVANLTSLRAYGAFGAAVLLLVWLYLSNAALLLGAEINATLAMAERVSAGPPPVSPPPPAPAPGAASAPAGADTASRAPDTSRTAPRAAEPSA